MPTEALARGITSYSFNNVAFPSNGTGGTVLAIPRVRGGTGLAFSWFTLYTGSPSAVSVILQGSDDNTNWFSFGTATTNTAGEAINVSGVTFRLVRAMMTSRTGGTNITVGITI